MAVKVEPTGSGVDGVLAKVIDWDIGSTVRVKVPVDPVALPSPPPWPWSLSTLVVVAVMTHVPGRL